MKEKAQPSNRRNEGVETAYIRFGGLGKLVQKMLEKANLNLRDAEKELGWNFSTWSRWSQDQQMIPNDALTTLAQAAHMDVDRVLAYGILNGIKRWYPDAFKIPKIRAELKEVLELLDE